MEFRKTKAGVCTIYKILTIKKAQKVLNPLKVGEAF